MDLCGLRQWIIVLGTVLLLGCLAGSAAGVAAPVAPDAPMVSGADANASTASVDNDSTLEHDAVDAATVDAGTSLASSGNNIELETSLSLVPETKGTVAAAQSYELPDNLLELEVTLPEGATIDSTDGFLHAESRTYRWDGSTANPSISYQYNVNRSTDKDGPIGAPGRHLFVDVGDWALVQRPSLSHQWGWEGDRVGFERSVTAPEGATSDVIAFLGEYEEYTHEAHDQTFRLIDPAAATLEPDRADLFESLADASGTLRVGDRDESVFLVAAPTGSVDWGVRGLQTGPADMWTRDFEPLDDPNNVWLHEYVHTRQDYSTASDLRWFTEATASYYAALLTLEQERITFEDFRDRLGVGTQDRFQDAILSEPTTWRVGTDYDVGALVTGELDRKIRLATDRERSFQHVFRAMNARDDILTAGDFQAFLETAGGEDVAAAGETHTTSTTRPPLWSETAHAEAFGPLPSRITFALSDVEPLTVASPYRDRPLGPERPVVLVPGEQLEIGTVATNYGGQPGDYEARLAVNDDVVETQADRLEPDQSRPHSFEYTFSSTGEFRLSVSDVSVDVSVRKPTVAEVTAFSADRTTVEVGETVTLSVTVENEARYPGERQVPLLQDGEEVESQTVKLDAGEARTVEFTPTLATAGTTHFSLGDAGATTITVTAESPPDGPADETGDPAVADDDGTGMGGGVVVAAVIALTALLLRRNRRSTVV